jgi:hypothetical protein
MNPATAAQLKRYARHAFAEAEAERLPRELERVRKAAIAAGWTFRAGHGSDRVHVAERRDPCLGRRDNVDAVYGASAKALLRRLEFKLSVPADPS